MLSSQAEWFALAGMDSELGNDIVESVKSFVYLGSTVTDSEWGPLSREQESLAVSVMHSFFTKVVTLATPELKQG